MKKDEITASDGRDQGQNPEDLQTGGIGYSPSTMKVEGDEKNNNKPTNCRPNPLCVILRFIGVALNFVWVGVRNLSFWQAAATIALVFVGISQFRVYKRQTGIMKTQATILGKQTKLMKRELGQMKKQTRDTQSAANAATLAANTSAKALYNSQHAFRIEQRPYVIALIPKFLNKTVAPGTYKVNVYIADIGKTPAIKILEVARLVRFKPLKKHGRRNFAKFIKSEFRSLKKKINTLVPHQYATLVRSDLAPRQSIYRTLTLKHPISASNIAKLKTGALVLYTLGIINYRDSTDTSYQTRFCFFYFGSNPVIWHICDTDNIIN